MFGFRRRRAAEKIAFLLDRAFLMEASFMKATLGGFAKERVLSKLERSGYLAGYVGGKFDSFGGFFQYKLGFSQEQIHEVRTRVIAEVYEDDIAAIRRLLISMEQHRRENTIEFQQGSAKGVRVVSYFVGVHDPSKDPDFHEAMAIMRRKSSMQSLGFYGGHEGPLAADPDVAAAMDAAVGLEVLWFLSKLSNY